MKTLGTIARCVFVSPEFLVIIIGIALCLFQPDWFVWLTSRVGQQGEVLKYAGLLPAGLVAFDVNILKAILLPDADSQKILQAWPRYRELKHGVVVGLFYAGSFALAGVTALLFDWKSPSEYPSALLAISLVGGLSVSVTLFFAHIKIEELFRENRKPKQSSSP